MLPNSRHLSQRQLHDTQGKRLYLTAEERRAFLVAAAPAARRVRTLCGVLHTTVSVRPALRPNAMASRRRNAPKPPILGSLVPMALT